MRRSLRNDVAKMLVFNSEHAYQSRIYKRSIVNALFREATSSHRIWHSKWKQIAWRCLERLKGSMQQTVKSSHLGNNATECLLFASCFYYTCLFRPGSAPHYLLCKISPSSMPPLVEPQNWLQVEDHLNPLESS